MIIEQRNATEGTRWYDPKTQQSVEDCLSKKGTLKKVTLREARKEGYIPSVTTVMKILAKPELEKWKMRQIAESALGVNTDNPFEFCADYIMEHAQREMDKARELGSKVHGEIDRWLLAEVQSPYSLRTEALCRAFDQAGVVGHRKVVESTFCSKVDGIWIAGKVDLYFPEREVIFDWKTSKKSCEPDERLGYDEHVMQMAAYSVALYGKFVDCRNVFISTTIEGNCVVVPWNEEELERGWEMYRACYRLWCLKNNYLVT